MPAPGSGACLPSVCGLERAGRLRLRDAYRLQPRLGGNRGMPSPGLPFDLRNDGKGRAAGMVRRNKNAAVRVS